MHAVLSTKLKGNYFIDIFVFQKIIIKLHKEFKVGLENALNF